MTPSELEEELAGGRLRPVYLIAGTEPLLREDARRSLERHVLEGSARDFNLDRLDGATLEAGALLDAVRSLPVLAPRRLVIVREPEARRRSATAVAEALATAMEEQLSRSEIDVVLVVEAAKIDRRARYAKACVEPGVRVACDPPKAGRALEGFIAEEARRQDVVLGAGAARALAERVGPHLLLLRQELAKAALYSDGGKVTAAHVSELSSDTADAPIWDLTDAIGSGVLSDALPVLARMQGAGAPGPVLLGSLASHFRKLARIRTGGEVAGHPFAVKKLQKQARRYSALQLRGCLAAIHDADEALKGKGGLPPETVLERLVLDLAGATGPR